MIDVGVALQDELREDFFLGSRGRYGVNRGVEGIFVYFLHVTLVSLFFRSWIVGRRWV